MDMICKDKKRVLALIDFVKKCETTDRNRNPENVFTTGNCGNLYEFLREGFHCAKPWGRISRPDMTVLGTFCPREYGHTLTEIDTRVFDINGVKAEYELVNCEPLPADRATAALNDMKNNYGDNFGWFDDTDPAREAEYMAQTMEKVQKYVASEEFQMLQ